MARGRKKGPTRGDIEILKAAQLAEALAVTTYTNIIGAAPFFKNIPADDQGYLQGALQEEMSHYLVGVRDFSTADLRVTAARIMGIESDHRTLARVLGPDVASSDGGPIEQITGFQKSAESVDPPNNNGYERTLLLTNIEQAVEALTPFASKEAAAKAGFDTSKPYAFKSFTPKLANPLGEFHSLKG